MAVVDPIERFPAILAALVERSNRATPCCITNAIYLVIGTWYIPCVRVGTCIGLSSSCRCPSYRRVPVKKQAITRVIRKYTPCDEFSEPIFSKPCLEGLGHTHSKYWRWKYLVEMFP